MDSADLEEETVVGEGDKTEDFLRKAKRNRAMVPKMCHQGCFS